jgi:hypothetical protein
LAGYSATNTRRIEEEAVIVRIFVDVHELSEVAEVYADCLTATQQDELRESEVPIILQINYTTKTTLLIPEG